MEKIKIRNNTEKSENKQFFRKDTVSMAKKLLGKLIIVKSDNIVTAGYIVETEAYVGVEDEACHTYSGNRTPKVEAMYMEQGTVYIYTMHTHKMLNMVSCEEGNPQAVLIRAIEPAYGLHHMEENRKRSGTEMTNGPGKLTKAMNITDKFNMKKIEEAMTEEKYRLENDTESEYTGKLKSWEKNLKEDTIYIDYKNSRKPLKIEKSPRIGIPGKGIWSEKNLRFYVSGNRFVSGIKKKDIREKCWK